MITLEDCLGFCDLTEEQVLAIAEHERMPEMAAIAYAHYLAHAADGLELVGRMIVDDIRVAQERCEAPRVLSLLHVLHHFLREHPEVRPEQHPWSRIF